MRAIELSNGYMVCIECRGFIEAGAMTPACECIMDESGTNNSEHLH